ncbi:MAG: hypothetical protein ACK513_19235 [Aphanizomenon sp.]|jgi:hypothetical protein|nr:hypothetical protein [Aphanizomenon flos-aquae UKL13-PB]MBO1061241.1 hypothetical protein [Aphanizomenon flos-aquae CP01]HCQ21558.1 hypothetical protein [Anabaena sp. UBA12330]
MASTVEFPFNDDEALPTIPIILSYANSSISANALNIPQILISLCSLCLCGSLFSESCVSPRLVKINL